jgi:pyruvate,orthophosphate dikinase
MTSHAAVVARGMGKCCVAGCKMISIDYSSRQFTVEDLATVKEGDYISLNGSTGEVMLGKVPTVEPELSGNFGKFLGWADEVRRLGVRTNADTPQDSTVARNFGAEGIGLTRTEHMFFEGERIEAVREMILAKDKAGRRAALNKILPMQREDFMGIFEAMDGLPVTIRTLDPPLHEFLPNHDDLTEDLVDLKMSLKDAKDIHEIDQIINKIKEKESLLSTVESLHELNPMLGHRGCRLGIAYPEITEMQARAIFEAACECKKNGIDARPEVMIPLIASKEELENQKAVVEKVAKETLERYDIPDLHYLIGTMIELPRAALLADEVAEVAQFFSFGTNDLTQTTFGLSRDDAGKFLPMYVEKGILPADPFQKLDQAGVGKLVKWATEKGRETQEDLKVGICGEHGGEPTSVEFCHKVGLNYVSCSPYRVPIARLAAAQALLKEKE